jgi:hypothetical protein
VNLAPTKLGVVCAVVLISVALPLALLHRAQGKWREKQESLRQQAGRLAQWAAENERLSNAVVRLKPAPALSDEQLRELLRLRSEVGELRRQTNLIRELRNENRRLHDRAIAGPDQTARMSEAELDAALAAETIEVGKGIARELPGALQRFAQAHTNAMPAEFSELRGYFPTAGGRLPGLLLFEFARDTGPQPGDALILRESGSREGPDGKWRRVYAFSDGRVVEALSEDGEFDEWEKERGIPPPPPDR